MHSQHHRDKCLDEKEEVCQECGSEERVEIHHMDGDRENNHIDNLIPLCRSCHQGVHSGREGLEHLTEQLLPDDERTRVILIHANPKMQESLDLVKLETGATYHRDAVMHILSEYHEIYGVIQDYRDGLPDPVVSQRHNSTYELAETVDRVFERHSEDVQEVLEQLS